MNDDNENLRQGKPLTKSLETIAALRVALEQRLAEAQKERVVKAPPPPPIPTVLVEEPPKPKIHKKVTATPTSEPQLQQNKPADNKRQENKSSGFPRTADPAEWTRIMLRIAERSQQLIQDFLARKQDGNTASFPMPDPAHLSEAFIELSNRILSDPERFVDAQISLWQGYIKIGQATLAKMQGKEASPLISPPPFDRRFQDDAWQKVWLFDYLKQSYLLTAGWVNNLVHQEIKGLDPRIAHKIEFYTRQMVDAVSPSNFWLTNPEVLRATLESGGENLIKGLENLLDDVERGNGQLRINMSDARFFKVGHNLAITPGKVVYQNGLMQLIQYTPQTPNVHRVPLLIVPPWINKYYVLDLGEKKSLIRYLVENGHTVFCISWVNPDQRHAHVDFEDYMGDGILAAMREIKTITGENQINTVGYCIGGTLLATTLAYLKTAPGQTANLPQVASATYLVTLTDFSEPGDLGVFMDEAQITALEARMKKQGYLDAAAMSTTFNMLRANDLIWSFVINNYMLGKEPFPFDILYWNGDSTNLPEAMESFYLRKMYLENKLIQPGGVEMRGVPIDLGTIDTPSFFLSTREDHIAPWRSTYSSTQLYKGPATFVLSGSGHIAGVINPPTSQKYNYWTNDRPCPPSPETWLEGAISHEGSWWPMWVEWLKTYAGDDVPARDIKNDIEAAPGSYVTVMAG
jgi:polyhydroxyalkanoate synthase